MPSQAKDAAFDVASKAAAAVPHARWVPRDNLHITVKFLGNVGDERMTEASNACATAVSAMSDFSIRLAGFGAFPSPRRARVLWIAIEDPAGGFGALSDAVEAAFAKLGFEREVRDFTAHLTVARLKTLAPVTLPDDSVDATVRVDRLTLFQSRLRRPSAQYGALAVFPFPST